MTFIVIIPARLASTRLPNKPLADIGGKPMVVRVAERAVLSGAARVLVAGDCADIAAACNAHGVEFCLTRSDHPSGTDRIAEAAARIGLPPAAVIVNVQGDEPLIAPALIAATAALVSDTVPMATAAHGIASVDEFFDPNIVKVVLNAAGQALYFSRAPVPWHRDGFSSAAATGNLPGALAGVLPAGLQPLRHVGLYAYRNDFLQMYPALAPAPMEQIEALEQLRVLWHGLPIAVHVTADVPAAGVDTLEDLLRVRRLFAEAII